MWWWGSLLLARTGGQAHAESLPRAECWDSTQHVGMDDQRPRSVCEWPVQHSAHDTRQRGRVFSAGETPAVIPTSWARPVPDLLSPTSWQCPSRGWWWRMTFLWVPRVSFHLTASAPFPGLDGPPPKVSQSDPSIIHPCERLGGSFPSWGELPTSSQRNLWRSQFSGRCPGRGRERGTECSEQGTEARGSRDGAGQRRRGPFAPA